MMQLEETVTIKEQLCWVYPGYPGGHGVELVVMVTGVLGGTCGVI